MILFSLSRTKENSLCEAPMLDDSILENCCRIIGVRSLQYSSVQPLGSEVRVYFQDSH